MLFNDYPGLPDYFDESFGKDYAKMWENYPNYRIRNSEDLLPLFLHKRMVFPKGQKFHYNHAGYTVLGLIIEAITNKPFAESQTYYSNIYSLDVKGNGSGGAYTTAKDMDRFWTSLLKGRLLSLSMVGEMLSPQVEGEWYGYGVWLKALEDNQYLPFVQGSHPGVSFISSYDCQKCRTMTFLSNFAEDVWSLHGKFYKALNR